MGKSSPIGLFDSGVGGLTVAHALHTLLPAEQLVYFGDTAHLPYGDKSKETILQYSLGIADFLLEQRCKVILIACNSASSNAFEEVKAHVGKTDPGMWGSLAPKPPLIRAPTKRRSCPWRPEPAKVQGKIPMAKSPTALTRSL